MSDDDNPTRKMIEDAKEIYLEFERIIGEKFSDKSLGACALAVAMMDFISTATIENRLGKDKAQEIYNSVTILAPEVILELNDEEADMEINMPSDKETIH